jgi:hypothetical protein
LKKILLAAATLSLLVPIAAAQAAPVEEFSFQLRDVKRDGRFTVVFTSRSYDDTGSPPPALTTNFLRLPKGAVLRREFLTKRYQCDATRLLRTLQAAPEPGPFFRRLEALRSQIRKIRGRASKKDLANVRVCVRAQVGKGNVTVDPRPLVNRDIPAKIYMYLSKPTVRGGVASFGIIGVPDETDQFVRDNQVIAQTRVVVYANFINEPTADGLYGYKLVLPTNPVPGVRISVAQVQVTTEGLTLVKKKTRCTRRRGGRCVRRQTTRSRVFWFTRPTCPASGKLSFQAFYQYETGATNTRTIELACPDFG